MLLAFALLASSSAALPPLRFDDSLRLVLAQDQQPAAPELYPPPPPLTPAWQGAQPPGAPAPAARLSDGTIFAEGYGADLGLRLLFEGAALVTFAVGDLALNPICGGNPNYATGIPFVILSVATLVGQVFAVPAVVGVILEGGGHHSRYWMMVLGDVLGTVLVGPALGLGVGYLTSQLVGTSSSGSALAPILGLAVFALVGALGAPSFGLLYPATPVSVGPPPVTDAPPPFPRAATSVPLLHLAFE